jgi:Leucine-rich repeat (LRR) protein
MKKILYCGILLCGLAQAALAQSRLQDSLALVDLYNATNGANWRDRTNWLSANPMNTWYGIALDAQGRVRRIQLQSNQLSGSIPNFNLPNLQSLNLSWNQLNGTIPNFNLPNLQHLDLNINQLTGIIPNFNLSNLSYLDLGANQLSGSIPNFNLPNLQYLDLRYNQFSGSIPNFNLPNLQDLDLRYNQFSGSIPNFNLPNLLKIWLNFNQLSDRIPNFNLPNLQDLRLGNNRLSGSIPNFSFPNLTNLSLYDNQLSGSIPNFNLPNLNSLQLQGNQLSGSIPNFNLPNLQYLYLSANPLSGSIPNFNLPNLEILALEYNQLSGSIPNFNLPNLQGLYLNSNQLSGSIPNFNLPNLQSLSISKNQLSGSIPNFSTPNLFGFEFFNNKIDSVPNLSGLPRLTNFEADTNKITFDDILPNVVRGMTYTKQDSIYIDTTFSKQTGESLTIPLGIDGAITTNVYKWYKNGTLYQTNTGNNRLIFNNLALTDAGVYTCQVTNPNAPLLTLYSRKATVNVISSCRTSDSLALVDLYNATGGANWTTRTNWLSANPMNTWYGITTNAQGCVTCIDLDGSANCVSSAWGGNNLVGTLPASLNNISHLEILSLIQNRLTGRIPNFTWANITELSLSLNQLTDTLPNFNLPNLTILTLSSNRLTGSIPNFNFPALQSLDLSSNQLTGSIPHFNFPNLRSLSLGTNQLTGSIPNFNFTFLTHLYLFSNRLTGNIPDFAMPSLGALYLQDNQLSGNLPNFNGTRLRVIQLQNNLLTGSIPNFTIDLTLLLLLNNQLSGSIPNFNLPNLTTLHLSHNKLSGIVPTLTSTNLAILSLQQNQIDSIPSLAHLSRLSVFAADTNKVTFDDILPNIKAGFTYGKQDSIYVDTSFSKQTGESLTIPLGIDGAITTNVYKWYKNGTLYQTNTGNNRLIFNNLALTDAGVYTCQVTNPNAPLLTLYSRKATVNVIGASCRTQDSLVLVDLYNATGGANWTNRTNWLSANPINTWYGIQTNANGCVICIDLDGGTNVNCVGSSASPGNNLVGIVPNTIGNLSKLQTLILIRNPLYGNLPTSLGRLSEAQRIYLSYNQFTGTIPDSLGNLLNLLELELNDNQLTGSIPTALGNLRNLQDLLLGNNKLSGNIPDFTFPALQHLWLNNNQFTGKIPIQFQNSTHLKYFDLHSNKIDSLPNLSMLANLTYFKADTLQITFDDILPNLARRITYTKQDSIFKDTTYTRNAGQSLTIDLGIDAAITTNVYKWFKNGVLYQTIIGSNKLIFNSLQTSDAGIYTCQVTNLGAPLLTLQSRKIQVVISSNYATSQITKWICAGTTYILPKGRIVQLAGTYFDTFRIPNQRDSIVTIHLSIAQPHRIQLRDSITCALRDTKTIVQMRTNRFGCDSIVTQIVRLKQQDRTEALQLVCDTLDERVDTSFIRTRDKCDAMVITHYVFNRCECLKAAPIYNALIPNDNDAQNDVFWINNLERFAPNELIITDKRNLLLYQVRNYKNDWTGTDQNGIPLPAGVYNYLFRMTNRVTGETCSRIGVIDIKYIP